MAAIERYTGCLEAPREVRVDNVNRGDLCGREYQAMAVASARREHAETSTATTMAEGAGSPNSVPFHKLGAADDPRRVIPVS
jgi:hypothetical protein